jgi:hypothetical protein
MVRVLTTFDPSTSKKEKTFITTRTRNSFEAALGAAHTDGFFWVEEVVVGAVGLFGLWSQSRPNHHPSRGKVTLSPNQRLHKG